MTVPAGMVSVPLPLNVPPDHVDAGPVRLSEPLPLSVPPVMVSTGTDCAAALLSVKVPPLIVVFTEYEPLKVLVPPCHATVPGPLIVVAASNVRVSLLLKMS